MADPTKVRVIMYAPYTRVDTGSPPYREPIDTYLGSDIFNRKINLINVLNSVVNRLNSDYQTDAYEGVVPIFVASEWYFRSSNWGAYSRSEMTSTILALLEESKDPKLQSLLIAPGTFYWYDEDSTESMKIVYNSVPVIKNGKLLSLVTKQFDKDRTDPIKEFWGTEDKLDKAQSISISLVQQFGDSYGGDSTDVNGYFSSDGVQFGLEICQDNVRSRLQNYLYNNHSELMQSTSTEFKDLDLAKWDDVLVDVHLVISNGNGIYPDRTALKAGGFMLFVDGGLHYEQTTDNKEFDDYFGETEIRNILGVKEKIFTWNTVNNGKVIQPKEGVSREDEVKVKYDDNGSPPVQAFVIFDNIIQVTGTAKLSSTLQDASKMTTPS